MTRRNLFIYLRECQLGFFCLLASEVGRTSEAEGLYPKIWAYIYRYSAILYIYKKRVTNLSLVFALKEIKDPLICVFLQLIP